VLEVGLKRRGQFAIAGTSVDYYSSILETLNLTREPSQSSILLIGVSQESLESPMILGTIGCERPHI
jgi:hypothetical protein